jgi:hypothetical protein
MAKGARVKKELNFKADTKFRGEWYAEEDLKEKLLDKFYMKGLRYPENDDIEEIIEAAYENNINL